MKAGHQVLLVSRASDRLTRLSDELGAKALAIDLAAEPDFTPLVDWMNDPSDGERVLVNNAGIAQFGDFATSPLTDHLAQIQLNLLSMISITYAVLPSMLQRGSGLIVQNLSIAATTTFAGAEAYSASKAGALAFSNSLRESYRRQGIRVSCVLPGATDTPIWGEQSPPREDMLRPEAVAETFLSVIEAPADRMIEAITVTPIKGVL